MTTIAPNSPVIEAGLLLEAVGMFADQWSNSMLASNLGPHLTCSEADTLIDLLRACGQNTAADWWTKAHAAGDDDPDDQHYRGHGGGL